MQGTHEVESKVWGSNVQEKNKAGNNKTENYKGCDL